MIIWPTLFTRRDQLGAKGVAIEHRQLLNYVHGISEQIALGSGASHATVSTIAADLGNTSVFPSLCSGGCLHILSSERALDPGLWREYFERNTIDCLKIVPSHLSALIGGADVDVSMIPRKVLVLGREASRWELVRRIADASPELRVLNHYGPTETTVGVLTYALDNNSWADDEESATVPLGRPLPNSRVYLLNSQLQPVPVGVSGELYIGGSGVGRGYLNRSDLTAEKFIQDPFSMCAGARMYRTGDVARFLSTGNIEFLGRIDHQMKVRGYRIEPGEIESVLIQHPSVRECLVTTRDYTASEQRLVAYVVGINPGITADELRLHLRKSLPEPMVPSSFVVLDELPLTANGKVDRNALPAPEGIRADDLFLLPRTPIEEGLAEIWGEVLRSEHVGAYSNFFTLGGHSLLAMQVVSRIRSVFDVDLPVRVIFEAPTVVGLAERIKAALGEPIAAMPPLVRVPRNGPLPLSFSQQRLLFLDQFDPDSVSYNIPIALRLTGKLNVLALQESLTEIVRRHEALRTTFSLVDGVPSQVIGTDVAELEVVDLKSVAAPNREVEVRSRVKNEAYRPFDLKRGPLFRAMLLRIDEDEHVLLLNMHHIVSDGWSLGVLTRELTAIYIARSLGQASPLPDLDLHYVDYACWQRSWMTGDVLDRQISYWKKQLAGVPALLELPSDRPRPAIQSSRGATESFVLSPELSQKLNVMAHNRGATLFMTLLAAFNVLLHRYTGQEDIVVATPIANRTRPEVEGIIGFFLNTMALRTDLSGDPSAAELLFRVRETALGAYAHQDLPFERLVDALHLERKLSHSPLFQAMLVLQNAPGRSFHLDGLIVETIEIEDAPSKCDLTLVMIEAHGQMRGILTYNPDLFDADRIVRMVGHYQVLLEGIVADPDQKLSALPLLTDPELHQLLVDWNDTSSEHAQERCSYMSFLRSRFIALPKQ